MGLAGASVVLLARPTFLRRPQERGRFDRIFVDSRPAGVDRSRDPRRSFADAVARAGPAVVNIYTARVIGSSSKPSPAILSSDETCRTFVSASKAALGSGVIVDEQGHLITNHHVIQGADEIRVQLADGRVATPRSWAQIPTRISRCCGSLSTMRL